MELAGDLDVLVLADEHEELGEGRSTSRRMRLFLWMQMLIDLMRFCVSRRLDSSLESSRIT